MTETTIVTRAEVAKRLEVALARGDLPDDLANAVLLANRFLRDPELGALHTPLGGLDALLPAYPNAEPIAFNGSSFQDRATQWAYAAFEGHAPWREDGERSHRFLEEALELVQANGCTAQEAQELVDYVFGRPVGKQAQEVGGVTEIEDVVEAIFTRSTGSLLVVGVLEHCSGDLSVGIEVDAGLWAFCPGCAAKVAMRIQARAPEFPTNPITQPEALEVLLQAIATASADVQRDGATLQ